MFMKRLATLTNFIKRNTYFFAYQSIFLHPISLTFLVSCQEIQNRSRLLDYCTASGESRPPRHVDNNRKGDSGSTSCRYQGKTLFPLPVFPCILSSPPQEIRRISQVSLLLASKNCLLSNSSHASMSPTDCVPGRGTHYAKIGKRIYFNR